MAGPDQLVLARHRDLEGREREPWVRRGLVALLAAFVAAGLAGVFGQRASTSRASGGGAELSLSAPSALRGGLYWQARLELRAREELREAIVVLEPGWLDGMTVNTIEPSPLGEASRDGRLALELGHVRAGDRYLLFLELQVNPTTVGRRDQGVELYDGDRLVARLDRALTVYP